jgi:hypothetical protein
MPSIIVIADQQSEDASLILHCKFSPSRLKELAGVKSFVSIVWLPIKQGSQGMPQLTDLADLKTNKFFKTPTAVVQEICPADDVSKSILDHMKFRYQLHSITPLTVGPHGGRLLLLYSYTGGPVKI